MDIYPKMKGNARTLKLIQVSNLNCSASVLTSLGTPLKRFKAKTQIFPIVK